MSHEQRTKKNKMRMSAQQYHLTSSPPIEEEEERHLVSYSHASRDMGGRRQFFVGGESKELEIDDDGACAVCPDALSSSMSRNESIEDFVRMLNEPEAEHAFAEVMMESSSSIGGRIQDQCLHHDRQDQHRLQGRAEQEEQRQQKEQLHQVDWQHQEGQRHQHEHEQLDASLFVNVTSDDVDRWLSETSINHHHHHQPLHEDNGRVLEDDSYSVRTRKRPRPSSPWPPQEGTMRSSSRGAISSSATTSMAAEASGASRDNFAASSTTALLSRTLAVPRFCPEPTSTPIFSAFEIEGTKEAMGRDDNHRPTQKMRLSNNVEYNHPRAEERYRSWSQGMTATGVVCDDSSDRYEPPLTARSQGKGDENTQPRSPTTDHPRRERMSGSLKLLIDAMNRTEESQQDIHDWDRSMGLRRSHSSTMRATGRSRRKLQDAVRAMISKGNPGGKEEEKNPMTSPMSSSIPLEEIGSEGERGGDTGAAGITSLRHRNYRASSA